uniref:Protein kinase domain-containing protein n=1 Tax=Aplanochytrium stocchinoi TaxID=215587 RepID=A0A7S3UYE3_9STRA
MPTSMRYQMQRACSQTNIPEAFNDSDDSSFDSLSSSPLSDCIKYVSHGGGNGSTNGGSGTSMQSQSSLKSRSIAGRLARQQELPPRSPSANFYMRQRSQSSKTIWSSSFGCSSTCSSPNGEGRYNEEFPGSSSKEGSYSSQGTTSSNNSYNNVFRRQKIVDGLQNRSCSFSIGSEEQRMASIPQREVHTPPIKDEQQIFHFEGSFSRPRLNSGSSTMFGQNNRKRRTRRATEMCLQSVYEPIVPPSKPERSRSDSDENRSKKFTSVHKSKSIGNLRRASSFRAYEPDNFEHNYDTNCENRPVDQQTTQNSSLKEDDFQYNFPLWEKSPRSQCEHNIILEEDDSNSCFEYHEGMQFESLEGDRADSDFLASQFHATRPANKRIEFSVIEKEINNQDETENVEKIVEVNLQFRNDFKIISYTRGQLLGRGTFGEVYLGINQETGSILAVKQMRKNHMENLENDSSALKKVTGEISVMESLDHPNIVRYFGSQINRESGNLEILLEYVSGGSIASLLAQTGSGFSEPIIKKYTRHMVEGITYLHSKGIIHRDIKGGNVLISDKGVAKLADFGCSKSLLGHSDHSLEASLKNIRGSILWMAPEVVKQTGDGRESADIWSLGATIIEMATARHPWPSMKNSVQALLNIAGTTTPPPFPRDISKSAEEFLSKCFFIHPQDRWSGKQLLEHEFLN